MEIANPKVIKIADNLKSLKMFLENQSITIEFNGYPVVYIHAWKDKGLNKVYVGESNDIFQRTKQHYEIGKTDKNRWQANIEKNNADLYIIGHEHFNKSLTSTIRTINSTVSGIVKNELGIAVANAYVGLYKIEDSQEKLVAVTYTNIDGKYMFGNVLEGQYVVKSKLSATL